MTACSLTAMIMSHTQNDDFDLDDLVDLEQKFYDQGFADGLEQGKIEGRLEGFTYGIDKGFDMWEEVGFYEGFAKTWQAVYSKKSDNRVLHSTKVIIDLIKQFPTENPGEDSDIDVVKLLSQIRSRYKMLCSLVGVKPSLRAGRADERSTDDDNSATTSKSQKVWAVEKPDDGPPADLSF